MRVYQAADGRWIYFDGIAKHYFVTEQEARDMNRDQKFITDMREHATALWEAWLALKSAQEEWNALDYGTNLEDGTGDNAGVAAADVGAVVFGTADAIDTLVMDIGHATNVAKLL